MEKCTNHKCTVYESYRVNRVTSTVNNTKYYYSSIGSSWNPIPATDDPKVANV